MRANGRVLVVDDDENIRSAVAELLSMEGYGVATAANGQEALRSIGEVTPDAIVLDLMMPVMDGWGFVARCRALPRCRDVPIVVMSAAYSMRTIAERLLELGVRAVIAKPFDLEALVRLIHRYAPLPGS